MLICTVKTVRLAGQKDIICTVMLAGPKDPRLFHLLENDSEAQAAHHVAEALKTAIGYYRSQLLHVVASQ